jgi:glutamate dehydrogenase
MPTERLLTAEQRELIRKCVADLPADCPLRPDACAEAIETAFRTSSLELRTAVSRFRWLAHPPEPDGIKLLSLLPSLTIEQLATHIVYPQEIVLEVIGKKTGLDRAFLCRIYDAIRNNGRTDGGEKVSDLTEERALQEMKWWLTDLTFPDYYFRTTPPEVIARQILLNRSYELHGFESSEYAKMKISSFSPDGTWMHWVHHQRSLEVEEEIEREYYRTGHLFDISTYTPSRNLLLYIVHRNPESSTGESFDRVAPSNFLEAAEDEAKERYEKVWRLALETGSIVIEPSFKAETGEHRLMLGFPLGFIRHFAANISRVMARNSIETTRKYAVTFGGPRRVIVTSLYARQPFPEDLREQLVQVSLYPPGAIAALVESCAITPAEAIFLRAVILFVHQFISVPDPEVRLLRERFPKDREMAGILTTIQARIDRDTFAQGYIEQALIERPDIIHDLFALFAARFDPACPRSEAAAVEARARLDAALGTTSLTMEQAQIVQWSVRFTEAVERTNFFLPVKTAVSFRLASSFFAGIGVESTPFGVFFVVGRDFHGFHVRFTDVARGGIRLVHSAAYDDYLRNADSLFEECYNLAFTQNKKNKDIPEGGSKGVILPAFGAKKEDGELAFRTYVDSLLDLLLPQNRDAIVGYAEEILFLGPDEGTAHLMDWASLRARRRGYRYWKAFTTGKSATLGGISHKEFGMTTQGVRRYVLGILRELGIEEESITKAQTGGPDGDLGSNEILLSRDRTIALIDGGGVLFDPDGLDRGELARLAGIESDSSGFDEKKLSARGFKVLVSDRNKRLPDGSLVVSGLGFRNMFHLDRRIRADLFLPCGGRPKSINLTNWRSLLDENGSPIFRWVVEGANLFITQEARLKLEEKGVVLFKDSSTNKGGVISSSLEVLAGLGLTDEEYEKLMTVNPGGAVPEFRRRYIEQTIEIISRRADQEFNLLWRTYKAAGVPLSELSETVSEKINEITRAIQDSALFANPEVRQRALALQVPPLLLEKVGVEALLERLPLNYQKALFACSIASSFVYRFGIAAGFEDYRQYVEQLGRG